MDSYEEIFEISTISTRSTFTNDSFENYKPRFTINSCPNITNKEKSQIDRKCKSLSFITPEPNQDSVTFIKEIVENTKEEELIPLEKPISSKNFTKQNLEVILLKMAKSLEVTKENTKKIKKCVSCAKIDVCNEWKCLCKKYVNNKNKYKFILTPERLLELHSIVDRAILSRTTFTIRGMFPALRTELLKRNWVEKYENTRPRSYNLDNFDDLCSNLPERQVWESVEIHSDRCEKIIMSRLLHNHDIDLFWNQTRDRSDWYHRNNIVKLLNRFKVALFTSKEGLALLLQEFRWHCEPGVSDVFFPRCYVLGFTDHFEEFTEDFRLTACMSLLKFFVKSLDDYNFSIVNTKGTVDLSTIQFALDQCNRYISIKKHVDLDEQMLKMTTFEWKQFLASSFAVVHNNQCFQYSKYYNARVLNASAKFTLRELAKYWPQYDIDGDHNIWLVKPANESQGKGIHLICSVEQVARIVQTKARYVVQKYIERPFLIYKTKFDIRQWFLVTCVDPLTIWMYKDSYLRFSSQIYSLETFHESYHLTNHAVQCKYSNVVDRDKNLPEENMWHSSKFIEYLESIGCGDKWENVIYPGMKEAFIGTMLACQDTMDRRPNTFCIFGVDYMIAEDFKPWLIEINHCPNLLPSTNITTELCPKFIADVVKVIIDKKNDSGVDTGLLQMVYRQTSITKQNVLTSNLSLLVRGHSIFKTAKHKRRLYDKWYNDNINIKKHQYTNMHKGPIIYDLIEEINCTHTTSY